MKDLILIGGGGHCKACIDVIESTNLYNIIGILDLPEKIGNTVLNYSIIDSDDKIPVLAKDYKYFFITIGQIGYSEIRVKLYNILKDLNINLPTIISQDAYVSKHSKIGQGTIIMHKSVINAGAEVGNNCIINNMALIEHDAVIKNHCHVSTGAIINGGSIVNDNCFVGSHATCIEYKQIPEKYFVKAGSVFKG